MERKTLEMYPELEYINYLEDLPCCMYELVPDENGGLSKFVLIDDSKYEDYDDYCKKEGVNKEYDHVYKLFFPCLKEDGGDIRSLNVLKAFVNDSDVDKNLSSSCKPWLYIDIHKFMSLECVEYVKRAIKSYAKVGKNPIYKQVLDKYNWND